MTMSEILYKKIPGFPKYLACSEGYVINIKNGFILRGNKKRTGYREICIKDKDGRPHSLLIHRIIAKCFCDYHGDNEEVNHIDGDKDNNRAANLEWVDHNENLRHAYETGLREQDVSAKSVIATNMNTGEQMTFSSIYKAARFFNISQGNICMCCKGLRPYANGYYWEYSQN